jgi:Rrf2 family iron-sulfur cluster assembly transcriptional regulator
MEITKAVKVALNTLVDIANHSKNGQLVPVPEIAQRLRVSKNRIELLLAPLRDSGLVVGIRGRAGGYQLSKDPRVITIKDIVLAMNRIKKRKVEVSDIAKELYQSLEVYMMNCISNVTLSSAIKDYIPRFSYVQTAPERKSYLPAEPKEAAKQEKKLNGEIQKVAQAPFKKIEEVPRGPNSVFTYGNYLTQV